jgi:aminoglycoside 6'-N-acetyltransferase
VVTEESYAFRPVIETDLEMLRGWLGTPEPMRWWGEPQAELALIAEDLGEPAMQQWIVSLGACEFAYAQAYEVHAWPQPHLADFPQGAMAIDAFIGVPGMIGKGHGGHFLRLLAQRLVAGGAPLVVIDPDAANERAQRAYRRAGFSHTMACQTPAGVVQVMTFGA